MKITIFSNSVGGVFYTTKEWTERLSSRGCDVSVFFLTHSKWTKHIISSNKTHFDYLTTPNFRLKPLSIMKSLTYQADVVHINFASYSPFAVFKKWLFKTPFIYTCHGLPQPWLEPSLPYKIAYSVEHVLFSFLTQASIIVAPSNYIKDKLKKKYGLDSRVIYHGIDIDEFKPTDKLQSKRVLGYKKEEFLVLFVGKLHPIKDPLTLILLKTR
jgi:glycosyltransferase involved in cell wall biosynthesis